MTGPGRWLPLRPRRLALLLIGVLVSAVLIVAAPAAFFYVGSGFTAPRAVGPLEYVPGLLAVLASACLAPRFPDWDRFGARRTRTLALVVLGLVIALPLAQFAIVLLLPLEIHTAFGVPTQQLLPFASNILVVALLASILHGLLGLLAGTLTWAGLVYWVLYIQSGAPSYGHLLPLTMAASSDGGLDDRIRWVWLAGLFAIALALAMIRRGVPIRLAITDERD